MRVLAEKSGSQAGARGTGAIELFAEQFCPRAVRVVTGLAIVALLLWMLVGMANLLVQLYENSLTLWTIAAEGSLVDALILLALLELVRTLQVYLQLGRVRVTFILDTALVVLISELMGLWFKEYAPEKVALSLVVIGVLVGLRIATSRFSPEDQNQV